MNSYLDRPGHVYFARLGDRAKVGWSSDVPQRARALRYEHGKSLVIVGTRPGSQRTERLVHQALAGEHIHGEWFHWRGAVPVFAALAASDKPLPVGADRPVPALSRARRKCSACGRQGHSAHQCPPLRRRIGYTLEPGEAPAMAAAAASAGMGLDEWAHHSARTAAGLPALREALDRAGDSDPGV